MDKTLLDINAPKRTLKFWHIWALGVGAVVGDGIFLLMGQGIAVAGPSSIISYAIAGIFQLFLIVALTEMAVAMPSAGAMTEWVGRYMNKSWGFIAGFTFAVGWVIAGGSVGMALGTITMWYFPNLTSPLWPTFFSIVFVTLFALLNIIGTGLTAKTQLVMVVGLVGIMVLFAVLGLKDVNLENYQTMMPYGWTGFIEAIPLGTYAYLGAITLVTAGAEAVNPKRDLPRALIWASITFVILYTLAHFTLQGIVPWQDVTMDSSPFTVAAEQVFGVWGGFIMNTAAWIAAATCILMGTLFAASRIFYQQAIDGMLPKFLGKMHPKTKVPVNAIILIWALTVLMICIGFFDPNFIYVQLTNQLTIAWLFSWGVTLFASVKFRQSYKGRINDLPWKQPLYPLFPILAFAGIAFVFYSSFVGSIVPIAIGVTWIGALLLIFYFTKGKNSNVLQMQTESLNAENHDEHPSVTLEDENVKSE